MTADRIIGALLLAAGLAFGAMALSLKVGFTSDTLGPRAYPLLVAAVLAGLSLALILRRPAAGHRIAWPSRGRRIALGLALASFVAYAQLLAPLSFPLATAAEVGVLCLLFGARPHQAALTGLATSAVLYLLFTRLLGLALPWGGLWGG